MTHIIHAGFHKTGTTSIQTALQTHAAQLRGWRVETLVGNPALRLVADMARAYSARPNRETRRSLRIAVDGWLAPMNPRKRLLVSLEDLSGHMPGDRRVKDYSAAIVIAHVVGRAVERHLGDGRLVYTTRGSAAWLKSLHWQLAKHRHMELTAAEFAETYAKAADLQSIVDRIAEGNPLPVSQFSLEDAAGRRLGPASLLYDLAGIDSAQLTTLPRANVNPDPALADAFVALNRLHLAPEVLDQAKADLLAAVHSR